MKRVPPFLLAFFGVLSVLGQPEVARAAITSTGSVDPGDPSTWDSTTAAHIAATSNGSVTVDSGSHLQSLDGYIAYARPFTGEVTVDGFESTWTNDSILRVGYAGNGLLNITNGATVTDNSGYIGGYTTGPANGTGAATVRGANSLWSHVADLYVGYSGSGALNVDDGGEVRVGCTTYVAYKPTSSGTIDFGPGGGKLITKSLAASPGQLRGTGVIDCQGLVSDVSHMLDSPASLNRRITFDQPGQNVVVNLDMSSGNGDLGVGWKDAAALTIKDGMAVKSFYGVLGYHPSASGTATITGAGSSWAVTSIVYVGCYGRGTLDIVDGGQLSTCYGYVGEYAGSTGSARVEGTGSSWTCTAGLYSGLDGNGTLTVARGGSAVSKMSTYVGYYSGSTGTMIIEEGGSVISDSGKIGFESAAKGKVLVTGNDAKWTNTWALYAGYSGRGELNVADGGVVSNTNGYVGYENDSVGSVSVEGTGSLWKNTSSLYVGHYGSGSVAAGGGGTVSVSSTLYVGDLDSGRLDINRGGTVTAVTTYIGYGKNSTGTIVVDGPGATLTNAGSLYLGGSSTNWYGNGTLIVSGGGHVSNTYGYIGFSGRSTGEVTVSGTGSTWTNSASLTVCKSGKGRLSILDGGTVTNTSCDISDAHSPSASGLVTVDGEGSTWTSSGIVFVGRSSDAILSITGGGHVNVSGAYVRIASLLAVDVGNGSVLNSQNGAGVMGNYGTIRIMGGAGLADHAVYAPIAAGSWSGDGVYQALGGTWDGAAHEFSVSEVQQGASATPITIDLGQVQRLMITDATTGWSLGASFLAKPVGSPLQFTARTIAPARRSALQSLLDRNEVLLGGWEFTATGAYVAGDPLYYSLAADAGEYRRQDMQVWRYDGSIWTQYDAIDLTYNGDYASFTVTDLYGYAVTLAFTPGDATGDGRIDETDAAALAAHWGRVGGWADGDFNGDGRVNAADAAILAANWSPGASESATAPEPSAMLLLATGVCGAMCVAGRRQR